MQELNEDIVEVSNLVACNDEMTDEPANKLKI